MRRRVAGIVLALQIALALLGGRALAAPVGCMTSEGHRSASVICANKPHQAGVNCRTSSGSFFQRRGQRVTGYDWSTAACPLYSPSSYKIGSFFIYG